MGPNEEDFDHNLPISNREILAVLSDECLAEIEREVYQPSISISRSCRRAIQAAAGVVVPEASIKTAGTLS